MRTKKQRKTSSRKHFVNSLKKLYPSCKHDSISKNYEGHKVTYGEMEYNGIELLYKYISKKYNPNISSFIDVGSGRGKLCMFMAAQPKIRKVVGIELVTDRHDDAIMLKSKLDPLYGDKVTLINSDIFKINLQDFNLTNVFVWFSNLCFDQNITDDIFKKLIKELPKESIICCSKQHTIPELHLLDSIKIPMSWNSSSNVNIYRL